MWLNLALNLQVDNLYLSLFIARILSMDHQAWLGGRCYMNSDLFVRRQIVKFWQKIG